MEVVRPFIPGSSPLTRGAPHARTLPLSTGRIIPAHAGSTFASFHDTEPVPDHPRSRGEHMNPAPSPLRRRGSSPLTRGARTTNPSSSARTADHPRSRGEHLKALDCKTTGHGSSPLTRGARRVPQFRLLTQRIIPAHAGSTNAACVRFRSCADHPRSRGEHGVSSLPGATFPGSSPLTRGALRVTVSGRNPTGIIPAHAGSTASGSRVGTRGRDHPRSRGEHAGGRFVLSGYSGSSPLTRGARYRPPRDYGSRGIIPAHAGSTASPR